MLRGGGLFLRFLACEIGLDMKIGGLDNLTEWN